MVSLYGIVVSSQRNRPAGLSPPIPAGSHTQVFPPVSSPVTFLLLSSHVCPLHLLLPLSLPLLVLSLVLSFGIPLITHSHYTHTLSYLRSRTGLALSGQLLPLQPLEGTGESKE